NNVYLVEHCTRKDAPIRSPTGIGAGLGEHLAPMERSNKIPIGDRGGFGAWFANRSPDSWSWTLNNSGGYTVASSRNMIDSRLLPKGDLKTRWIRYVPNKVNTFAWKVMTNSLPTRFNISRRGIDIESLSCVNCDVGIETNDHLFFACNTAKKISKLINRWWDVPFMDINSYGEWRSWIDNVKLPKKNKSMFQGIYFVMWWLLWNFRNKKMFEAKPKSKETFFDEIICSSYYWCRYRCNTLFSWDDWYKNPSLISL
ncbi:RNA-directed DNA polymerase, eukaryota, partial [Tanacetum coccineum]